MTKIRTYLPLVATLLVLGAIMFAFVYRAIHPIPPHERAFVPKMKCRWIGDAEVCEPNPAAQAAQAHAVSARSVGPAKTP